MAAMLVVLVHVYLRFDYISDRDDRSFFIGDRLDLLFGEMGVDAFFIISGFIMMLVSKRMENTRSFLLKRSLRIYPPYWIFSALMVGVLLIEAPKDPRLNFDVSLALKTALLIPYINEVTKNIFPLFLSQGWTLIYELIFYLVFAIFLRSSSVVRFIGTATVLALLHIFALTNDLLSKPLDWVLSDSVILEFCIGLFFGWLYSSSNWRLRKKGAAFCVFSGFILFLIFQKFPVEGWGNRLVNYAAPLALLFFGTLFYSNIEKIKVPRILTKMGDASYTIYLTHTIVIFLIARLNRSGKLLSGFSLDLQFPMLIVLAAAVGFGLYVSVERPLLRVLRTKLIK